MTGHDLAAADFGALGLEGDRRWAVVHASGKVATRRELPQLAHLHAVYTDLGISLSFGGERLDVLRPSHAPTEVKVFSTAVKNVQDAGNYASHFLSSALECPVRLVYFPEGQMRPVKPGYAPDEHYTGFADEFPVLVVTMASLFALNSELSSPIDIRRFRANVVVGGDFEPWAEDTWRRIQIGSVILRIVKPCERCIMVTQDPKTGEVFDKLEPLSTLRRIHRSANGRIIFGQNAVVEQQGAMSLGDEVKVLEKGESQLKVVS
jgi:uncharacterized protein YcbX